jgi:hypothetical protein
MIRLYEVLIDIKARMVVHAKDAKEAEHLAQRVILNEYPRASGVCATALEAGKATRADAEKGLVRSETQICTWCGTVDHKSEWGPGYMTCPNCGRHPRNATEQAADLALFAKLANQKMDLP